MDETAEGVIPSWVEAKEGNSITLRCGGSIKPVEWACVHFDNKTKSIDNNAITLYNLQKEHSGRYFCRGIKTNSDLKKTIFHDYAVILVDSFIVFVFMNLQDPIPFMTLNFLENVPPTLTWYELLYIFLSNNLVINVH